MTTKGKEREKGAEAIFEEIMIENFSQINVRHQATDPKFTDHQAGLMQNKTTLPPNPHIQKNKQKDYT